MTLTTDHQPLDDRRAERPKGPASTEADAGPDPVFCPQCPGWWRLADINAVAVDGTTRPWQEVVLRVERQTPRVFRLRRRSSMTRQTTKERSDIAGQAFAPVCPLGHALPNSLNRKRVIGVIGNVRSSKSHYLTGTTYELLHEQRLTCLEMDVAYLSGGSTAMERQIEAVYSKGEVLPNSERGALGGPYTYRLTPNVTMAPDIQEDLVFFDAAGEDCTDAARSATITRYLFDAVGIILLIDPGGLPGAGRPLEARGDAKLTTRALIDTLADSTEAVKGQPAREQDQIIVIALAKADSAELPEELWPPRIWPEPGEEDVSRDEIRNRLARHSDLCQRYLEANGGRGIVAAAQSRFAPERVHYAAVSATGESAVNGTWQDPQPIGCSIPIAQILLALEN